MKSRNKTHKTLFATLVLFGFGFLSFTLSAKSVEKSKKVNKTFTVKENQVLDIDNKFGDVSISSWDKNEVQLDVEILVDQRNEEKAEERLKEIDIKIKESASEISISTDFSKEYSEKMDGKAKLEINYTIKMPANMVLELENKFGDITIDRLTSRTEIELQFGSAKIGKLESVNNDLTFKFSDPVIIDELGGGAVILKFSKMNLTKTGPIEFESQMSNSEIGLMTKADLKVSYGSLRAEEVESIELSSSMSTIQIDKLHDGGDIKVSYGKFNIENLSKEFSGLTIDAKFTPVELKIEEGAIFELDADTKMSNLFLPSGYEVKDASDIGNNEYFKGKIGGDGTSLPIMKISNQFGKVEIK